MPSIIDRAKEASRKRQHSEDAMAKLAEDKRASLSSRLETLVGSIVPEVQSLDGESTKFGKLSCKPGQYGDERLRILCGSSTALILSADIHTYEDCPYDYCLETRVEPRVTATVFHSDGRLSERISTYEGDSVVIDQFLDRVSSELSRCGWI